MAALPSLIEAGVNVYDRIQKIQKLAEDASKGTVTQTQIDDVRVDRAIGDVNVGAPHGVEQLLARERTRAVFAAAYFFDVVSNAHVRIVAKLR